MTNDLVYTAAAILVSAALMMLARISWSKFSRFDVEHELTEADNPAVGTAMFGFMGGVLIVLAGLLATDGAPLDDPSAIAWDLGELAIYGTIAILLLQLSGWLNDRVILYKFDNRKELVDDRNLGTGAVLCGSYLATGLVLAGAFSGRVDPDLFPADATRMSIMTHELLVAITLFVICQVMLAIYGLIYQKLQRYDLHDAIERDYVEDGITHGGNAAAGIAFGGNLVALGLVLWGGAHYDFEGWSSHLKLLAISGGTGLVLLPLWRVFVDHVMLAKADLAKEIYEDRNVNAALLETAAVVGLATVLALTL